MIWELLSDYSFLTVAAGTVIFAAASSVIGTITVLTRQSLIGDSLGHASFPGVVLAFMLFQSRQSWLLLLGAILLSYLAYSLIYLFQTYGRQSLTNSLSLIASSFFGMGLVLQNLIQGNPAFSRSSQAGLKTYIFGQAAFIQLEDVYLIGLVAGLSLLLFFGHYQAYKIYLFDQEQAALMGISPRRLRQLTILLMISLIAVGLKVVGAVLMSSFLIAPAILGLIWGRSYRQTLWLAGVSAVLSAFLGTVFSSLIPGLSTGPSIIVLMSSWVFLSLLYQGIAQKRRSRHA